MKTNLKKNTFAALIAGIFFIATSANAATIAKHGHSMLPDTGKMSKMSDSKMHGKMDGKMSKKKKMDKMSGSKMSDSKMKSSSGDGKM
ncbi:MAG: hypothetical protein ACTHNW_02880 [Mucilaginibacter sp.]